MFDIIYRYDPNHSSDRQQPADTVEACRRLVEGNRLFSSFGSAEGSRIVHIDLDDIGMSAPGVVPKQQPFAVLLGCADARVPPEMIFDCTCNELFVVRVAGNIISEELLGSIDYAVEHLGENLKVIVVLGHSQCGAVTAAVDAFRAPGEYLGFAGAHHVRSIVDALFPAIHGAEHALRSHWGNDVVNIASYRVALIETSVIFNAALMASILRTQFPHKRIMFGIYDLATRLVCAPGSTDDEDQIGFFEAPSGEAEFGAFASETVKSKHIQRLLRS